MAMIDKVSLKKLLEEDLKEAFDALGQVLDDQDIKINEFINLKGIHNKIERDRRIDILSTDEYYRAQSMLRLSCLGLIDDLSDVIEEKSEKHENHFSDNIEKKYPRLEIELVFSGKWKSPKGLSPNNKVDENGAVWLREAIYFNEIGWRFKIIIRNNSSYPAFYPELEFPRGEFQEIEKLNKNKPIKPFEEVELNAKSIFRLESTGAEAYNYMNTRNFPDALSDLIILLNYESEDKQKRVNKFELFDGNGFNEIIK